MIVPSDRRSARVAPSGPRRPSSGPARVVDTGCGPPRATRTPWISGAGACALRDQPRGGVDERRSQSVSGLGRELRLRRRRRRVGGRGRRRPAQRGPGGAGGARRGRRHPAAARGDARRRRLPAAGPRGGLDVHRRPGRRRPRPHRRSDDGAAGQDARGLLRPELHGLRARAPGRLRRLGGRGRQGLGLRRRAAVLREERGPVPAGPARGCRDRRRRARHRRPAGGVGAGAADGRRRAVRRGGRRRRDPQR